MEIKNVTIQSLESLGDFIDQLGEELLVKQLDLFSKSTIGQHVRHILEFYTCLLSNQDEVVCYDKRKRELLLETDIDFIQTTINGLKVSIANIEQDKQIRLMAEFSGEGDDMYTTSLLRELVYCLEHQVHHLAIIKIGVLNERPDFVFDEGFGVAYATIKYRKACAQ